MGNNETTYRLGGGTATLYIGLAPGNTGSVANQLFGDSNLVVGAPITSGSGGVVLRGTGIVVLNTAQNYTGQTLVNAGSTLQFRGALNTSGFEVFGNNNAASTTASLIAGGVGGAIPPGRWHYADCGDLPSGFHDGVGQ
ncbi:MAG: hypothetical protein WDN28_13195 [Chthoniobacter sp.]